MHREDNGLTEPACPEGADRSSGAGCPLADVVRQQRHRQQGTMYDRIV